MNPSVQTVRRSDLRRAHTCRNNTRSTPIKLSFRRSLSVINVLSLSSACVQLRPNPRPDATVREKKQARDSSRQRDPDCRRSSQPHLATPTASVRLDSIPDRK
ncbi:hypothetical protein F2Q68_00033564 [Brassica cretica]|uniref:Uncharacterized protein n=2 Tax=Brassica cretica TaxID=69181 RepID=A0A8S9HAK6_BRACR|nr:hypothetical protein F2Q68_00033564 [Brassica cretica]KAF3595699.1 hypothetical protein DY000_02020419 [Brassica cretica]